jgi:hypothetical protein
MHALPLLQHAVRDFDSAGESVCGAR